MIPNVLSIAGTDPTGGAGIQADLKAFSATGAYGLSVITALVAQNTRGVDAIHDVPGEFVTAQLDAVFSDVRVDAVKIGMLSNAAVIAAVVTALGRYRPQYVVLDPVMVAKSGDRLLAPDAVAALRDDLLPLVDLVTPNLPEAADLLGARESADLVSLGRRLRELGAARVLVKGGHLDTETSDDVLVTADGDLLLSSPRIATKNTHGTGCTLSAAIAALRPQSGDWESAVRDAKTYLTGALQAADGLQVGSGHGPVDHFWRYR